MGPSSRLAIEQNSGPNPNTAITAALYVFGRDLRLDDHRGLAAAATLGTIVPGYIEDPGDRARALNPRRAAYREAALGSLAAELAARGARLCIRRGPRAAVLVRLARELEVRTVVWSAGYGARALARDRGLQAALEEAGLAVRIVHDAPAVSPEQIVAARAEDPGGYRSFAAFASAWEAQP
ncbi:MAG: deoxyribodipyrimidine photo-lyase, partial [Vulcanimicrobiaceae bacterium]